MPMSPRLLGPRQKPHNSNQLPVTAGLMLWLDGADSSTMFQNLGGTIPVTGAAQPVLRWDDKSGNGRNATATRPLGRIGGTYPRGSGYTSAPTVTIVRDPNDSTGVGATATATVSGGQVTAVNFTNRGTFYQLDALVQFSGGGSTLDDVAASATVGPTRHIHPPGVMFNNGSLSVQRGPYMEIPATTIPQSYTVFSVYTRIQSADASLPSLSLSTGFSTPSEAAPQGSRYASFWGTGGTSFDNLLYTQSTSQQSQFTTHSPQRGFHNEITVVKTVRTAGVSVAVQVNDMPTSVANLGAGVTNPSNGVWSSVGCDVNLQGTPAAQVLRAHRGPMHEIIVYDRALTTEEQNAVAEYLRVKWSVAYGSQYSLDWKITGPSAWPGYRWSMADIIRQVFFSHNTIATPAGTYTGGQAFGGGVLLSDGRIFILPNNSGAGGARIYNPANDSLVTPPHAFAGFQGGVLMRDGRVFCVPNASTTARVYDPVADTLIAPPVIYHTGSNAFIGGVLLPDGRVYCAPANNTEAKIYDPTTNTTITPRGRYTGTNAFAGGVLLPDGRVFLVPHNSQTAFIFDPASETVVPAAGTYPGNGAFYGGVLLPDGRVFCVPYSSLTGRIYNPANNTTYTPSWTLPSSLGPKYAGGVLLADGTVFCVPLDSTTALIYNPATDTVFNSTQTFGGGLAFMGGVGLPSGKVFLVPRSSTTARLYGDTISLTLPQGTGFNSNVALSAYYNKF